MSISETESGGAAGELEVAIIGAGFGGLCMAIQLQRRGVRDFRIFEQADGPGGTWRANAYPGLVCDIPAHFYSLSIAPKPDWSRTYPAQPEIRGYLEGLVERFGLSQNLTTGCTIREARYEEAPGRWRLTTADGETILARSLVCSTGQLGKPFTPEIPGRDSFSGASFHSARWDHSVDLRGKRVAVIGNAASAVQFIPEIAPLAEKLFIFQRSAQWVLPQGNRPYSRFTIWLYSNVPGLLRIKRALLYLQHELRWPAAFAGRVNPLRRLFEAYAKWHLRRQVKDPELRGRLVPDYPIGCKRILISDAFYPALNRENVELLEGGAVRIAGDTIHSDANEARAADVLIYATGYNSTQFVAPLAVYGREGRELQQEWRDGAEAYLGVTLPGFPNFYLLYGPNTNLGHNSIVFMIEQQVRYVLRLISRRRKRGLRSMELREEAMQGWRKQSQRDLAKTVWATGCRSWYMNAAGRIVNNWPYSTLYYWLRTRFGGLGKYRTES